MDTKTTQQSLFTGTFLAVAGAVLFVTALFGAGCW